MEKQGRAAVQQGSIAAPLPDRQVLRQEVAQWCPDVPPQVLDEVFAQLDDDYFRVFTVAQIATHVRLLAAVDDQHPVQIRVVSRHAQRAEILVAAVVGSAFYGLLAFLERAMTFWHPSFRGP